MSLSDICTVNITKQTRFPSQAGFGEPMFVAYHSYWPDRVREFGELSELTTAGVSVNHPIYLMATAAKSQNPSIGKFLVGRRANIPTQAFTFTVKDATQGTIYALTIKNSSGVTTSIAYTVLAAATTTTVATALAALIDADADVVATSAAAVITATTTAGKVVNYSNLPAVSLLTVTETTTDPGITADLAAIETAISNSGGTLSFYGMSFDTVGELTGNAIAAWTEARHLIAAIRSSDSGVVDPANTTDIASDLKAASYARTFLVFAQNATNDYRDAAVLGMGLPYQPGEINYAFKTLAGITVDKLATGEESAAKAKNANVYITTNSVAYLYKGTMGGGEYIDVTVFLDWVYARIQEEVFGLQVTNKKVPYTQKGIDLVVGTVQTVLDRGTRQPNAGFSDDPAFYPKATGPKIASVPTGDKKTRVLNNVNFTATLTGAIDEVRVNGTVTL